MSILEVGNRRAIIDRRALADQIAGVRPGRKRDADVAAILGEALAAGREDIARRLADDAGNGRTAAQATAYLHDQLVRLAYDFVAGRSSQQPTGFALVGLGGT